MKNKKLKIISVIFIIVILMNILSQSFATDLLDNLDNIDASDLLRSDVSSALDNLNVDNLDLKDTITNALNKKSITPAEITQMYEEISQTYSNKEIGQMIKENADEIAKQSGIDKNIVNTAGNMIGSMNKTQVKTLINNYSETIAKDPDAVINGISTTSMVSMFTSSFGLFIDVLLANPWVKVILITLLVLFIYRTILFWIIYHKAGRHGFAVLIPLYRQMSYLRTCDITPLYLFFIFIPVVGWLSLFILGIICRFKLAKGFGKGAGFGFGLLFFNTIFLSIIAFGKDIKYVGFGEDDEEYEPTKKEIKKEKKEKLKLEKENSKKETKEVKTESNEKVKDSKIKEDTQKIENRNEKKDNNTK